jgi:hypothetical protein
MTEVKHVCVHFLSGNCKYGDRCTKAHTSSTPDLLLEIERKGTAICNYHPTCIFSSEDCKRLHVTSKNTINNEINEMKTYYNKLMEIQTTDQNKLYQIERIRSMIKLDLEFIKQTYDCLKSM